MTNQKDLTVNGRTADEWNELLEKAYAEVDTYEARILEDSKDLTIAAKKSDMQAIKNANRSLTRSIERLDSHYEHIEILKDLTVKAERHQAGLGPILEFVEEVYEADMAWYKQVKEDHAGKTTRELRESGISMVEVMIAKMPEKEAIETFKKDLEARYHKLVRQLESKVGVIQNIELERNGNLSFDGIVEGEEGSAVISTIVAGGHNIQRAHYRTLVKPVK